MDGLGQGESTCNTSYSRDLTSVSPVSLVSTSSVSEDSSSEISTLSDSEESMAIFSTGNYTEHSPVRVGNLSTTSTLDQTITNLGTTQQSSLDTPSENDSLLSIKDSSDSSSESDIEESSLTECAICLEPVSHPPFAILHNCMHRFHESCIKEWFETRGEPICPCCNGYSQYRLIVPNKNQKGLLVEFDPDSIGLSYQLSESEESVIRSIIPITESSSRQNRYPWRSDRVHPILRLTTTPPLPPSPPPISPRYSPRRFVRNNTGCCLIS